MKVTRILHKPLKVLHTTMRTVCLEKQRASQSNSQMQDAKQVQHVHDPIGSGKAALDLT